MLVKRLLACKEIVAGDETRLREILNPEHDMRDLRLHYSLAHAIVRPGQTTLPHRLKTSSEVYYILQGRGVMTIDDESLNVGPGDTVYIPPDSVQYIKNIGNEDLAFLCIVSPPWRETDEVVIR